MACAMPITVDGNDIAATQDKIGGLGEGGCRKKEGEDGKAQAHGNLPCQENGGCQITMLGLRRFWSQSIRLTWRTAISQRPPASTKR